jgi:hypothetical protein
MKRLILVVVMVASLGLVAGPALAANPHVVKGPDVTVSDTSLTVTASIAGLGNVDEATFNLDGTVEVFSRCYNKGGNKPQADNKQETITVAESETFPVRNGRTNVSFTITPLSTLTCPGNQRVVIESLTWDLVLSGEGLNIPITGSA